jgi:hypothetical protein
VVKVVLSGERARVLPPGDPGRKTLKCLFHKLLEPPLISLYHFQHLYTFIVTQLHRTDGIESFFAGD